MLIIYFLFRNLTGKVTALFKYEDKSDINNCRPITVLPKVSKILERVLHQHLYGYMTEPNLLTAKQFSYALNYTPRSYLLILRTEFWRNLIMNEYRGSISRSYKGFWYIANDSPQLTKLKRIGASHHVTGWLTSYLSNRLPFIDVDYVQFIH